MGYCYSLLVQSVCVISALAREHGLLIEQQTRERAVAQPPPPHQQTSLNALARSRESNDRKIIHAMRKRQARCLLPLLQHTIIQKLRRRRHQTLEENQRTTR